jgi:hypothetical protein
MWTKAAKLMLYASLFVIVLLPILPAGGCGSATTQTPVTTTTISVSNTSLNELDIDRALLQHVIDIANTQHGRLVLAKLLYDWSHDRGHGPFKQNQDGSWLGTLWINESEVKGNELLEPVLKDPIGAKYTMEWNVSGDGLEFTPVNDNAVRLEAELGK